MSIRVSMYDAEAYDNGGTAHVIKTLYLSDYTKGLSKNDTAEIELAKEKMKNDAIALKKHQLDKNYKYRSENGFKNKKAIFTGKTPANYTEPLEVERVEEIMKNPGNKIEYNSELNMKWDDLGPQQASTILLGSSKRGKSTLLKYLFKRYYSGKDFISTLFSINAHIPMYDDWKLKCSVFNKRTEKYIEMEHHINKKTGNKYYFNNVFDDVLDIKYKTLLNNLLLTYRNSNMSTIVSLQYMFLLSKMVRANANNFLFFGFNSDEAILDVVKTFLKSHFQKMGIRNLTEMVAMYKKITDDHGFIYFNPISDSISYHRLNL